MTEINNKNNCMNHISKMIWQVCLFGMLFFVGVFCGLILESIHNYILIKFETNHLTSNPISNYILNHFRSSHKNRLVTGWASALSAIFMCINFICLNTVIIYTLIKRKTDEIMIFAERTFTLFFTIILFVFFLLLYFLLRPVIPYSGIMGIAEGEVVSGDMLTGNLVCISESFLYKTFLFFVIIGIIKLTYQKAKSVYDISHKQTKNSD